uniref:Uncharacterized protein n=1 Tax=Octopus bimaculoides TaxID=37653 RepID=A0A0L8G0V4_OCTBM
MATAETNAPIQGESIPKQSFSQAVGGSTIELKIVKESLYAFRKYIQKVDGETKLIPPPETVNARKEKIVVYKVYNIKMVTRNLFLRAGGEVQAWQSWSRKTWICRYVLSFWTQKVGWSS